MEEEESRDDLNYRIRRNLIEWFGSFDEFSEKVNRNVQHGIIRTKMKKWSSPFVSLQLPHDSPSHIAVHVALQSMRNLVDEPLSALPNELPALKLTAQQISERKKTVISMRRNNNGGLEKTVESPEPKHRKCVETSDQGNRTCMPKSTNIITDNEDLHLTFSSESELHSPENAASTESNTVEAMLNIMTSLERPTLSPISDKFLHNFKRGVYSDQCPNKSEGRDNGVDEKTYLKGDCNQSKESIGHEFANVPVPRNQCTHREHFNEERSEFTAGTSDLSISRDSPREKEKKKLERNSVDRDTYDLLGVAVFQGVRETDESLAVHFLPRIKIVGQIMLSVMQYQIYLFRSEQAIKNYTRLEMRTLPEFYEIRQTSAAFPVTDSSNTSNLVAGKPLPPLTQTQTNISCTSAGSTPPNAQIGTWITSVSNCPTTVTMPQVIFDTLKSQVKTSHSLILASRYWEDSKSLARQVDVGFIKNIEAVCGKSLGMDMPFEVLAQFVLTAVGSLKSEYEEEQKLPVKPVLAKVKPILDIAIRIGSFHSLTTERQSRPTQSTPQLIASTRAPTPLSVQNSAK
ncbi:unnamed protein product [Caenorhabditis sp. 36 PRJEB53466]|nr:unnamed protein product [Caenorhabditis sp. 36 PRJEB53466]